MGFFLSLPVLPLRSLPVRRLATPERPSSSPAAAPSETSTAHPAAVAPKLKLAPADEYFGPLKMSVLGIRNQIHDLGILYAPTYDFDHALAKRIMAKAVLAEASLRDWEQKYPADGQIPRYVYLLDQLYSGPTGRRADEGQSVHPVAVHALRELVVCEEHASRDQGDGRTEPLAVPQRADRNAGGRYARFVLRARRPHRRSFRLRAALQPRRTASFRFQRRRRRARRPPRRSGALKRDLPSRAREVSRVLRPSLDASRLEVESQAYHAGGVREANGAVGLAAAAVARKPEVDVDRGVSDVVRPTQEVLEEVVLDVEVLSACEDGLPNGSVAGTV